MGLWQIAHYSPETSNRERDPELGGSEVGNADVKELNTNVKNNER